MKILILTNLFPTPWDPLRSAFNRQQFELLAERHDVDILTAVDFRQRMRGVRGTLAPSALRAGYFTFVYPPRFGRSLHALCWLLSLWLRHGRRLRKENYDCILVSWAYPDAAAVRRVARWLDIPYVVKVHGSDLNSQAEHALRRMQIRSALRAAAGVVAVSRALGDKAVEIGAAPERVQVIYNGVDGALFAPGSQTRARVRLAWPERGRVVLFIGNLKAGKGCLDLLEALPKVLATHSDTRLVYVGDGPCRKRLVERAVALDCSEHVQCVGAIEHASLGDWFRAADLLCLPSYNEGVPNVVLEAMSCGIPVVATRVGGIPEVVPAFAGTLVPAGEPATLSQALVQTLDGRWDSQRIHAHAREFNWRKNVDKLDAILQGAADHATCATGSPA